MNIKNVKVVAVTLATLQALTLSSCKNTNTVEKINLGEVTIDNLYTSPYKTYKYDMIVNKDTYVVEKNNGIHLRSSIDKGTKVKSLETNGEYTLIEVNDNEYYIKSSDVSTYKDLHKDEYTKTSKDMICYDSIIYDEDGVILSRINSTNVAVIESNSEFSHIYIPNLSIAGYIENSNLYDNPKLYNYDYEEVNDTMYILNDSPIYDINGTTIGFIFAGDTCTLEEKNDEYSYITYNDTLSGFVKTNALVSINNKENSMIKVLTK